MRLALELELREQPGLALVSVPMALGEALEASASSVEERVPLLLESAFFLTVMLILVAKF
jgi:hypothetical protein